MSYCTASHIFGCMLRIAKPAKERATFKALTAKGTKHVLRVTGLESQ